MHTGRSLGLMVLITFFLYLPLAMAGSPSGQKVFDSLDCGTCHQKSRKTISKSLEQLADTYTGRKGHLVRYLQGDVMGIINPDSIDTMMKRQIKETSRMDAAKIKALADYILSF